MSEQNVRAIHQIDVEIFLQKLSGGLTYKPTASMAKKLTMNTVVTQNAHLSKYYLQDIFIQAVQI